MDTCNVTRHMARRLIVIGSALLALGCQASAQTAGDLESSPVASDSSSSASSPSSTSYSAQTPKMRSLHELLLFQPEKFPKGNWEPEQLNYEDVWFKADDGTQIHAWYLPADDPRAVVLYAHGNAGNLAWRAKLLKFLQEELDLSVLAFDYRGYGRSEGKPTIVGALQDARAARAELARLADVPPAEVVLMGRSLGGAIAIHLAAETAPRALVVESTFSSLHEVARVHYSKVAFVVPRDTLNNVSQISRYEGPLLYSHGTADRVIPLKLGEQVFAAASGPKTFLKLPGLGHNTRGTAEYYQRLEQFLISLPEARESQPEPDVQP